MYQNEKSEVEEEVWKFLKKKRELKWVGDG